MLIHRMYEALRLRGMLLLVTTVAIVAAGPAIGFADITVDHFESGPQSVEQVGAGTSFGEAVSPLILGGERDTRLIVTAGIDRATVKVDQPGRPSILELSNDTAVISNMLLTFDGVDMDGGMSLDPTGLGGFDLVADGNDRLLVRIPFNDQPTDVTFRAFTDGANWSALSAVIPQVVGVPQDFEFPLADFTPILGAGVDFMNLGALQFEVNGPSALDFEADLIAAIGQPQVIPEPGTFAMGILALLVAGMGRWYRFRGARQHRRAQAV